ncbi:hypothetical protein UPYG_G00146550 [Umbra pygmaea]|uniref:G-protein coupled receptors family 1 profile domain-containing protein n=1 Tax=Umbra pygmaea TaxID=75934 RepID=A0ABD0WWD4_UMBPY
MDEWKEPVGFHVDVMMSNGSTPTTSTLMNWSCAELKNYMVLLKEEKKAISTICFLAGPFTFLENFLVLGVIAATANLRKRPSYLFIGSLALADVFASCFFTVSFLDFHLRWPTGANDLQLKENTCK